ncbi:Uncharacterized conserved protein YndB, AHSA1/START domain [Catalinimonas alkaloidigena]|uniref:Uncharacterized conserved protein YndB, AHSA1/START domain n=1 Tax=Catalinimonas alkaloidigena TaxID=1075417 RepID=A0A1G9H1G5_9BACT|nr:SRPBCC domain-containing protein [Catalinimonas alkaloidigena]SDL06719.1 Uncharacterized conserved protein YndB, AHSA1/START domain [Catalinimonas alkaloidigena]
MKSSLLMEFSVDKENNTIHVKREFAAPLATVWAAWTEARWLDQWWAPKPWKAETKTLDFTEGGHWLYAMVGPDGETHWSRADFHTIVPLQKFETQDAFCDESGQVNTEGPRSYWLVSFEKASEATLVNVHLKYDHASDLEKILEMGFKEGFTAGLENLDEVLAHA